MAYVVLCLVNISIILNQFDNLFAGKKELVANHVPKAMPMPVFHHFVDRAGSALNAFDDSSERGGTLLMILLGIIVVGYTVAIVLRCDKRA